MSVNRTAEYVTLWKSRQRSIWEANALQKQADALLRENGPAVATLTREEAAANDAAAMLRWFSQESQRLRKLAADLDADLERVYDLLGEAERASAEKTLRQWVAEQESVSEI